ncbi:MAG: hypothetical protein CM15mP92_2200 [Halieaceae bacterium]|nr:MAG: hypothetical protein CM15mP92_2200 [Halieaceae bacterium]
MQASPLSHQSAPLSRAIADRVLGLQQDHVPQDVWDYLKLCLADASGLPSPHALTIFAHLSGLAEFAG